MDRGINQLQMARKFGIYQIRYQRGNIRQCRIHKSGTSYFPVSHPLKHLPARITPSKSFTSIAAVAPSLRNAAITGRKRQFLNENVTERTFGGVPEFTQGFQELLVLVPSLLRWQSSRSSPRRSLSGWRQRGSRCSSCGRVRG